MKILVVLLIFIFNLTSGQFRYMTGNDWNRLGFKNKIKESTATEQFFSKSDSARQYKRITHYSFNKKGKLIATKNYKSNFGNPPITVASREIVWNEKGFPTLIKESSGSSTFEYPKDSVVLITMVNNDKVVKTSKYIQNKNIETTYQIFYVKNDKELTAGIYEYDLKNRIVQSYDKITASDGSIQEIKISSVYNKKCGLFIRENFGEMVTKNVLNKNCHPVKTTQTIRNDSSFIYEFIYSYDNKGNWTERTTYLNGKKYAYSTRNLIYY